MTGKSIWITSAVIVVLAGAETSLAWRYFRQAADADRIARIERQLAERNAEVNRLLFRRDVERREVLKHSAARPVAPTAAGSKDNRAPGAEDDLAAAAALGVSPEQELNALYDESSEFHEAKIDPKHLVNMANIMTGKTTARLTQVGGANTIHYQSTQVEESDPLWTVLDAVSQAKALRSILLVTHSAADSLKLKRLKQDLIRFGLPERLIQISTGDPAYRQLEGVLIRLGPAQGDS